MNARSLHAVPADPVEFSGSRSAKQPASMSTASLAGPAGITGSAASVGIAGIANPAGWAGKGLCVGRDPDELFVTGAAQRDAARLCSGCPVRLECLSDALDNEIEFGVWGGLTERQRRALLRQRPDVSSWRDLLEEAREAAVASEAS